MAADADEFQPLRGVCIGWRLSECQSGRILFSRARDPKFGHGVESDGNPLVKGRRMPRRIQIDQSSPGSPTTC